MTNSKTVDTRKALLNSTVALILITSLLMTVFTMKASAHFGPPMFGYPDAGPVIIDGAWSTGEWSDTPQYTMAGPTGQIGYIRAKFNSTHLLVLIDSPWDTTPSRLYYHENVWLAFDTRQDDGPMPDPVNDYLVHASTEFTQMGWQGSGFGGWNQVWLGWAGTFACVQAGGNFGMIPLQPSPNSPIPHRISELAVPLALVGYPPISVGFYAQVDDDSSDPDGPGPLPAISFAEWPIGAGGIPGWPAPPAPPIPTPPPFQWGDLVLIKPPMYAPPLAVPVTIDGSWSLGEWSDAPQYTMIGPSGQKGYIRAKFNMTHLLVLIDSPWDTTPSTLYWHENVWLAFDTQHDDGPMPDPIDYLIHATTSFTQMGWQGSGFGGWNQVWLGWAGTFACVQAGENWGAVPLQPSPNSPTPHRISELAVPLSVVEYPPNTVGFYAQVDDDSSDPDGPGPLPATSYAEWPIGAGGIPGWPTPQIPDPTPLPSAWGDLILTPPPVAPDIAVTQIEPFFLGKTVVCQTYSVRINVTLMNQGASDETFDLAAYANATTIETQTVVLVAGGSKEVTLKWNVGSSAKGNYTFRAYAWPVLDEMDTIDNDRSEGWIIVSMVGDISGKGVFPNVLPDGKVDIKDIAAIAKLFGVNYPDARYVPNFDLNDDGKIDIKDIAAAAKNFGKIDP